MKDEKTVTEETKSNKKRRKHKQVFQYPEDFNEWDMGMGRGAVETRF
jgi:hypothetical protein